jgi:preprotein translocase subunit SecD
MRTNLRVRVALILAVLALCIWSIYPPSETIKLGLDLKGGVHLVLRVKTDEALLLQTRMNPEAEEKLRQDVVDQVLRTIERRVNELGVAEPVVARYTRSDQILVQLPGVTDVERAKKIIKSTAQLRLTLVQQGPFPSREAALRAYNNAIPSNLEVLPGPGEGAGNPAVVYYVVDKVPAVAGTDLRDAQPSFDEFNRPAVAFSLTQNAARRFGAFTERNVKRVLATVLDDRVVSVATILSRIDGEGRIVGINREEMLEQVVNLKSGVLPADLEYVEQHTVGASLGEDSIRAGVIASLSGLVLVMIFMLAYYRLAGLNALVSIVMNLLILLGLVASIPVTMTLPGIAGLILTVGIGVDSNVLIFERIKEELAAGRTTGAAISAAFDRVWLTIVDTHVASLIAAAVLYQFGTSSIRGFATTLTIGLLANVFTAVFVSRTVFELLLSRRKEKTATLSI